ncbi:MULTISPECIES: ribosomal-processing cysteine protease Prp [Selenomonas]|uniref:Ribosomal processing cysteine protease Prp n=1 Tax=Selenomonas ruminis TaxID=2593411 RepID=A0A5D6VY85_9FIRM|nr:MULTISPECIES: ribosomal-processing cysteine protease Prp [unclassified Selenomonas]MBQ1868200.1 ribosomal-processing cysteine protease Prp [Selenomonas sp.]TYZ21091.1 ribosomal-processing cysteine protease Prp [Selenomonas sp. mPRGC5]
MIEIRVFSKSDGKITGFSVSGHSGTAEHGQDIVCAGVSSLTQTALLGIMEYLHREVDYDVASGKLLVELKCDPDDLTEAILQSMLLGLIEIQKLSPEAVRILK